jgi:hypothetical protein
MSSLARHSAFARSIVALFCCGVLACWPPEERRGRANFEQRRQSLEALVTAVRTDGFQSVELALDAVKARRKIEGEQSTLPQPQAERYSRMLEEAGTRTVTRIGGEIHVDAGEVDRGGSDYSAAYLHSVDTAALPPECARSMRGTPCGECTLPLDGPWHIYYRWLPRRPETWKELCTTEGGFLTSRH